MKWIEPKYTKAQVRKAGKNFVSAHIDSEEFEASIPVLLNWRAAHAFPMQIILDLVRKNVLRIDSRAISVQRLKRTRSITNKLFRESGMSLNRIEDIAGCRAVLDNIKFVSQTAKLLSNSRTKNKLHRTRDYINNPKFSGYRGIHIIFKYDGSKTNFKGLAVEIQLRSKIQHSWATAVEVVGAFTNQALKASGGNEAWLDFFKYAGEEFAKLEDCPGNPVYDHLDTFSAMTACIEQIGLFDRLRAFRVATKALTQDKEHGAGYFILLLDLDRLVVSFTRFGKSKLEQATDFYDSQEQLYREDPGKDLVLVSAESVKDLKKAYPNYFSDTEEFEKYIRKVYDANKANPSDAKNRRG